MKCQNCNGKGFVTGADGYVNRLCPICKGEKEIQPITNGDQIRAMTDEQWACVISKTGCGLCSSLGIRQFCKDYYHADCVDTIMAWLKQPAKGEAT